MLFNPRKRMILTRKELRDLYKLIESEDDQPKPK